MCSVLGNHKTMTHRYTVNVIHVYNRIIVHTQQLTLNLIISFLVVFLFSKKNIYCCRTRRLSVCPPVRRSVRLSSVEIISFCGILISNRPIDLKIGLIVRKGVVHVREV